MIDLQQVNPYYGLLRIIIDQFLSKVFLQVHLINYYSVKAENQNLDNFIKNWLTDKALGE